MIFLVCVICSWIQRLTLVTKTKRTFCFSISTSDVKDVYLVLYIGQHLLCSVKVCLNNDYSRVVSTRHGFLCSVSPLNTRGGTGPDFSSLEPCILKKFELGPSPSLGPSMKFELRALSSSVKTARAGPGPRALPSIEAIYFEFSSQ